jgi:hypothetical protein
VPAEASFLRHIPQPHSSKLMTTTKPPRIPLVVTLSKIKLGSDYDLFLPEINLKEQIS